MSEENLESRDSLEKSSEESRNDTQQENDESVPLSGEIKQEPEGSELTPEDFIAPDDLLEDRRSQAVPTEEISKDTGSLDFFRDLLRKSHVDDASTWITNHDYTSEQVNVVVHEVFQELIRFRNFPTALEVGRKFEFSKMVLEPLYLAEWSRLCEEKRYEDAAEWAKEQGMSAFDVTRAGNLAYEWYLKKNELEKAIEILRKYKLDKENLVRVTIPEFNRALKENEFYKAAVLGREFNFSTKRTNTAAIRAMFKALKTDDFEFAADIQYRFGLISDTVFDSIGEKEAMEFKNNLISHLSSKAFTKGRLNTLKRIVDDSSLLTKTFSSKDILEIKEKLIQQAITAHNSFMKTKDAGAGQFIFKMFDLFNTADGYNAFHSVIEEAFIYHNELLRIGDINRALDVKNQYNLLTKYDFEDLGPSAREEAAAFVVKCMEKGDHKTSKMVISEYRIKPEMIEDALFKLVFQLAGIGKYKDAVSIVYDFSNLIRINQLREKIVLLFKRLTDAGEYLIAADFAVAMDLNRDFVDDASSRAWIRLFKADKHEVALEVKRKYKIPKRYTQEAATKAYWVYINNKDYEMAVHVRKSYRVQISLTQWIMELLSIIFKK